MTEFCIRYRPDSDLGQRFKGLGGSFPTREAAEALLRYCTNASDMEIVEVEHQ